jgi:hypothetical protein
MERDPDMEITTVQGFYCLYERIWPPRAFNNGWTRQAHPFGAFTAFTSGFCPLGYLIMGGHAKPTLSEPLLPLLA